MEESASPPVTIDELFEISQTPIPGASAPTAGGKRRAFELGRQATEVSALEFSIDSIIRGNLTLHWTSPGASACEACQATPDRVERNPSGGTTARFALLRNRAWRGEIATVELRGAMVADTVAIEARSLRFGRLREPLADRDPMAVVRVDLDHDVRAAILADPDRDLTFDLPDRPLSGIALGVAAIRSTTSDLAFRAVWVASEGDERASVSRTARVGEGWTDFRFDLPGRSSGGQLRLEVRGGTQDAEGNLPIGLWSAPRWIEADGPKPPNLVLVVLDTLRGDRLSSSGYGRNTTPRLDDWIGRHGTVFERATAQAAWTLPSHVSIFSGLAPASHGTNFDEPIRPDVELLAERLRRLGYHSIAVTGGGFVHPRYGFARGFDSYSYFSSSGFAFEEELESNAARLDAMLARGVDEPFFLFFHTYEMHNPYTRREPWATEYSGRPAPATVSTVRLEKVAEDGFAHRMGLKPHGTPSPLSEAETFRLASDVYDSQIPYLDRVVATLLERIERATAARDAFVVVTSDHGELFGEHGYTNHGSLYEGVLGVPLLVGAIGPDPGWVPRVAAQVRLIDVMPTLLDFAGAETSKAIDGTSLRSLLEGRSTSARASTALAASSNFGLSVTTVDRRKLIFRDSPYALAVSRAECFDLANDPLELRNLCAGSAVPEGLKTELRRRLEKASGQLIVVEAGASAIRVGIRGPDLRSQHFKFAGEACGEGSWRELALELAVEAGGRCGILVYSPSTSGVELGLPLPGAGSPLDWRPLDGGRRDASSGRFRFDGTNWSSPTGGGGVPSLAVIEWRAIGQSAPGFSGPKALDDDPELEAQLRALGYLE